jgi:DNA-binding PadR family transcriptional regulator
MIGPFQEEVLHSIRALKRRAYGARIHRHLVTKLGRDIAEPQVYAALRSIERKGYVSSSAQEPPRPIRGALRRFYRVERPGMRVLKAMSTLNQ